MNFSSVGCPTPRWLGLVFLVSLFQPFLSGCGDDAASAEPVLIIEEEPEDTGDDPEQNPKTPEARCGDATCNGQETAETCPEDCPAQCEDGLCTHAETAWTCPQDCPPSHVTVRFQSALIGPVKVDGCQWDGFGCGKVEGQTLDNVEKVLQNPYLSVIIALYRSGAFDALEKPDPMGQITHEGSGRQVDIPKTQDAFIAPLGTEAVFRRIPYTSSQQVFQFTLSDSDLSEDDSIWNGTLRFQHLEEALLAGEDHWIDLRQASQNQLVGILVTVTPD